MEKREIMSSISARIVLLYNIKQRENHKSWNDSTVGIKMSNIKEAQISYS